MSEIGKHWGEYGNDAMCADTRLAVAGTTCCYTASNANNPRNVCIFRGERTTYMTAQDRCEEIGLVTCPWSTVPISDWCGTDIQWWDDGAEGMCFSWTSEDCSVKVQINARGWISLVHDVGSLTQEVKGRVRIDSGTFFRVLWEGTYPTPETCGETPGCEVRDATCLCSTSVDTSAAFEGVALPSKEHLKANLHIGAVDPAQLHGEYIKCTAPACYSPGFDFYFKQAVSSDSDIPQVMDANTIFEVDGTYLSNTKSVVSVGSHSFRNPPMFNSLIDQTQRDALYETDAVLMHYATHSNTAPFVAMRLIQHLVTSNPSPRYVGVVSKAFGDGVYEDFGSGQYGDLEAAVAAVLLDQEARSITLELDSTSGKAREPLLKLIAIFRAMKLDTSDGRAREIDMM